jgi:hypothetical protein
MPQHKPIAVLLVHPADTPASPARPATAFYEDLFTNDPQSLYHYWSDVSDGAADLLGTRVFGWRSHGMTRAAFQALPRLDKIKQAVDAFANASDPTQRVDLSTFDSVAVFGDPADELGSVGIVTFDLQGTPHDLGTSIFDIGADHRTIAHEVGHGFGFDHSFNDSPTPIDPANDARPGAYGDGWDIMSGNRISFRHPRFGMAGPGLNTVMRDIAQWLSPSRVINGAGLIGPAKIFDVNDHVPGHSHVLKVDEFYFELRMNTGWDRGMPRPGVQVRIRAFDQGEHSKLLRISTSLFGQARYNMSAGDSYAVGDPLKVFQRYLKVTVQQLDQNSGSATLAVEYHAPPPVPQQGPGILIGGVASDAGGWIIVGNHIHRVPPRSPIEAALTSLGTLTSAEQLKDPEMRSRVERAAIADLRRQMESLEKQR